jgi:hypothetical protein
MKTFNFVVIPLIVVSHFYAEEIRGQSAVPENVRASYNIDRFGDGIINEMIFGIPLPGPKVVGDTYISQDWKKGKVLLYGQEKFVGIYPVRYDLYSQEIEIQSAQGIRVIAGGKIRSFVTVEPYGRNSIFINIKEYSFKRPPSIDGFLKVVEDGPFALLSSTTINLKRPDYNEALNVGSRDYRIHKREKFFFLMNGTVTELPLRKKEFASLFPVGKRDLINQFIRDNNLRLDREPDLIRIFSELNSQ